MSANQVADTLAVMAVIAIAIAVATGVALAVPASRTAVRRAIDTYGPATVALVAVVATGSSLWFSESAGFPPCRLCWFQRIAVYPLVVVLGLRLLRRGSQDLRLAALMLLVPGIVVNAWHIAIETVPDWDSGSCSATVPCTIRWVEGLDFFTIPRLATVAMWLIAATLLLDRSDRRGVHS